MKQTITACLQAMACLLLSVAVNAQLTENFNSGNGVPLSQVPTHLTTNCWQFSEFDTDPNNWNPGIEGDGAMISTPNSNPHVQKMIFTPVLDVPGMINLQFKYAFSNNNGNGHIRYLRIYLTDAANNIVKLLDSLDLNGKRKDEVYTYNKTFTRLGSEGYKIMLNYGGTGLATRIAIDNIQTSANTYYAGGCDTPPVAVDDELSPTTNNTTSIHGIITDNDFDPDNEPFSAFLISQPSTGTVVIHNDNSFTFTPNSNFTGNDVIFTYRICEDGPNSLCSEPATVRIKFPQSGTLPASLVELSGSYRNEGKVDISWITTFESNTERFDIERSFDGRDWERAGTVKAMGYSTIRHTYSYIDMVGQNTANKKDIFYRLRQVDKDGRTAVTRILVVRVYNTKAVKTISVTPNPAKSDISVQLQLTEASMATIRIRNTSGHEVMKKVQKLASGSHNILMEGSSRLQPGMYVLEVVINSKERMIVKLIKE